MTPNVAMALLAAACLIAEAGRAGTGRGRVDPGRGDRAIGVGCAAVMVRSAFAGARAPIELGAGRDGRGQMGGEVEVHARAKRLERERGWRSRLGPGAHARQRGHERATHDHHLR